MASILNALALLACVTQSPRELQDDKSRPQDMTRYAVQVKAIPAEARTFCVTAATYKKLKKDNKLEQDDCWNELPEGKVELRTGQYAFRAKWGKISRTVGPMTIENDTTVPIRKDEADHDEGK
jgi:hypothetical protein